MRGIRALIAIALLVGAPAAWAAPVIDCPMRDAPFSIQSPIVDILLNTDAKALVETQAGDLLKTLPPRFFSTTAPTFAAILTMEKLAAMKGTGATDLSTLDAALRKIPVTPGDRIARCARYDNDRPALTLPAGRPRLLLFEKMTGFRDGPSVDAARAAFQAMAKRNGWALVVTDKGGAMRPSVLRRFDAVIWNNVSGDVLTVSQRKAFRAYLESGGGFIGVHGSAGDPASFWNWYVDNLIGARFAGHPMNPQFQDARIALSDAKSPLASGLPNEWVMNDEWYSFTANPRATGADIVATLDESTYSPVGMDGMQLRMGDHPIAWSRCVGKGRMFYSAIGHRPETYDAAPYVRMLENAIRWTGNKSACQTKPVR